MNHQAIKIIALLLLSSTAILLTSCLDEEPKDQLTEEELFSNSTSLIQNTVATLYNYIGGYANSQGLQGTTRGVYDLNEFTTDEAIIPTRGTDWYDGGLWQSLYLHTWTANNEAISDTWKYLYKVIVLCNRSLSRLNQNRQLLTEEELQQYTAEVRALRALFYFHLLDLYGRVPIVVSEDVPLAEVKQSERSEVFWFVVDELQQAIPHLAIRRSNFEGPYYGRITTPVAWFLLAKLALNAEVYTDDQWTDDRYPDGRNINFTIGGREYNAWEACIAWCDRISSYGYQLDTDYTTPFSVNNESSRENIFTIPMDKTLYSNQFQYLFRSRHYNHGSALGMGSENGPCATITTVKAYGYDSSDPDSRYEHNFFSGPIFVDSQPVMLQSGQQLTYYPLAVTSVDITNSPYEKTAGARMYKYEIDRTAYSDGKLQDNDIVLFRYADVLLMRAEALVRLGRDANTDLNCVRQRSNMNYRQATLSNILSERMLELCWEGWRRQDLIRFRQFHLPYDVRPQAPGEADAHTTVFPIPQSVINLNHYIKQNPGY